MLNHIEITQILFLDIETVPIVPSYNGLDETFQSLWKQKSRSILKKYDEEVTDEEAASVFDRAGIYAEFGKIICISVGFLTRDRASQELQLRTKSFKSDNEDELLMEFKALLDKKFHHYICGHNIKEFDMPYICRRMLINQIEFPSLLDIAGKKPWEVKQFIDTLELWKFGDNKAYTSLKLLAAVFGFPSPKDDIDGSEVAGVYWENRELSRIAKYCEKDVLATVQLFLKYRRQPILSESQITSVTEF
ncbi:MAG: hypothetical protein RL757_36 [Bacteroidota bacterium]|jgi:DNA polymerase elongation subunit (family B)